MTDRLPARGRLAVLAAVAAAFWAGPARADALDEVVKDKARAVVEALADKGYKTVGVLRFEVQKGGPGGDVYMRAGRLHDAMATRVENALALAVNPAAPEVVVVRGAGATAAAKDPAAGYRNPAERAALFAHDYTPAWGPGPVKADAFLTGRVTFSPDYKEAIVLFRAFDKADPGKWKPVIKDRPTVPVSTPILADINQPFVAPLAFRKRGGAGAGVGAAGADNMDTLEQDAVIVDGKKDGPKADAPKPALTADPLIPGVEDTTPPPADGKPAAGKPADPPAAGAPPYNPLALRTEAQKLVDFRVYYDNVEQPRVGDAYPTPRPGQAMKLTLTAAEPVAVVLMVNGINTAAADEQNLAADAYKKWVLAEPGKLYEVSAYHTGNKRRPFVVLPDADAAGQLSELTTNTKEFGKIDLQIFRKVGAATPVTARGLRARGLRTEVGPAATAADLQAAIRDKLGEAPGAAGGVKKKGLAAPGQEQDHQVDQTDFHGVLAARLIYTYSPPSSTGAPQPSATSP